MQYTLSKLKTNFLNSTWTPEKLRRKCFSRHTVPQSMCPLLHTLHSSSHRFLYHLARTCDLKTSLVLKVSRTCKTFKSCHWSRLTFIVACTNNSIAIKYGGFLYSTVAATVSINLSSFPCILKYHVFIKIPDTLD